MKDSSEGFHLLIDALLTTDDREFTRGELAEAAGVSRHTVRDHIGKLLEHGNVETIADGTRVRFYPDSPVAQEVCAPNSAVTAGGAGHVGIDPGTGAVGPTDE